MDETVENGDKLSERQNRTLSFFTGRKTTTVESNTSCEHDQWSQSPNHSKTKFVPILIFGGIVWMTTKNIQSIDGILYEMLKGSIGAIYNVNQSIA